MWETSSGDRAVAPSGEGETVEDADRGKNVFGRSGDFTEYFPAGQYRRGQREAIDEIEYAFEQGYRFIILQAPTGVGKSLIAAAVARAANSAHILTVQKVLQSQYERDFDEFAVLKGRSAYPCNYYPGHTCADSPCRRKRGKPCSDCPYVLAKKRAQESAITVHNFDSFYYQTTLANTFAGRDVLVVDEAHGVENKYLEFRSFSISNKDFDITIPQYDYLEDYDGFVKDFKTQVDQNKAVLEQLKEADAITADQVRDLDNLTNLSLKMGGYLAERNRKEPAKYVFDYEDKGSFQKITFRPIFVGSFVYNTLFKYGERILLQSASILSKRIYCESVGIDPSEAYFIDMPSPFPPENHRFQKWMVGKMNYRNINENLPKVAERIHEILDRHPNRKGIIQTHSEKIARFIRDNVHDSRLTFNRDYFTPQEMLKVHKEKEGSVIVASGLREGLDLYGDLSQIQIFCKVPYPSMGDKRIMYRMEVDPEWYTYVTALNFVQALGRSIRSENDKALTYLLDNGFSYFMKMARKFLPDHIIDSYYENWKEEDFGV